MYVLIYLGFFWILVPIVVFSTRFLFLNNVLMIFIFVVIYCLCFMSNYIYF